KAPAADTNPHSGELAMTGPVYVQSTHAHSAFSAKSVHWLANSQELVASGDIRFYRGVSRLTGSQLEADSQLRRVRISGPVRADVALPVPQSMDR
ncbi:MAG: hypothetical protein KGR26_16790, partial [Cyanobacteria bacterium REEB65]|nr:hypothetical protein [Cyanobacteria bacterium REEB65]